MNNSTEVSNTEQIVNPDQFLNLKRKFTNLSIHHDVHKQIQNFMLANRERKEELRFPLSWSQFASLQLAIVVVFGVITQCWDAASDFFFTV